MKPVRLGEILVEKGIIKKDQLDFCLEIKKIVNTHKLGYFLRHYNFIDDADIARTIAEQVGWKYFEGPYSPDMELVNILGKKFCKERSVFPVKINGRHSFVLINTDDPETTDKLQGTFGKIVDFYIGDESSVALALDYLDRHYNDKEVPDKNQNIFEPEKDWLKWIENIINNAIAEGASDIHIESSEKVVEVRLRIDGVLHFKECIPIKQRNNIANIIFNKAEVNISEFDTFHDARFEHIYLGRSIDIRVSHIPAIHGSTLVLRLLDKSRSALSLRSLGYCQENWEIIVKSLKMPHGIILVTGPTGCGKTTTLYSMLNYMKSIDTKIVTIEDPVEIKVSLLTQVQINEKRGITFQDATRAFLRHDPDIILIGEIRDEETAKEAIRASITGHKVFSTLHTNTPIDALLRLKDLGVDKAYIANSLVSVLSQRLLRILCPSCKKKITVSRNELGELQQKYIEHESQAIYQETGCSKCVGGFWGRTVVAEILYIDKNIKKLICENKIELIEEYLESKQEHKTIQEDAARLVKLGVISLSEAVRVLG